MAALVVAASGVAGVAGAAGSSVRRAGPRAIVEYLPAFVYERENVSVRIRVENPGPRPLDCTLEVDLPGREGEKDDGSASPPQPVALSVAPGRARSGGLDLPATGWSRAECRLVAAGERRHVLTLRRYGEDDPVPPLEAAGERLHVITSGVPRSHRLKARLLESGFLKEAVVVSVRKRRGAQDREWRLFTVLAEHLSEGELPAGVLLLGPRLGRPSPAGDAEGGVSGMEGDPEGDVEGEEEPAYFRAVRDHAGTWVETAALPGEAAAGVTSPVLADFARALHALDNTRRPQLVVWVVSCDDVRRGTPLRTFRKAADFLLSRARRRSSRIAVVFVPEPGVPAARRALYSEELGRAASAYRAIFTVAGELGEKRCWTKDGGSAGPLMRYPNARGHEALAQAVLDRIRP